MLLLVEINYELDTSLLKILLNLMDYYLMILLYGKYFLVYIHT